jgi:hypothetical protein
MSLENATANLKEFGKELNLEGLAFDENHTCILGIDNVFSLHLTYEPNSQRLYLYAPIIDGLPKDKETLCRLYETLLEGSMLGGQMAGGGVGVAVKEELILMHAVIEMVAADTSSLRRFAPVFVEAVEKWRDIAKRICEGRYDEKERESLRPYHQGPGGSHPTPGQGHGQGNHGKPGDVFKRV